MCFFCVRCSDFHTALSLNRFEKNSCLKIAQCAYASSKDCLICGIFFFISLLLEKKRRKNHYCRDINSQCEVRQSGWHGKGVIGGDVLPFLCNCFTAPWPHLFLAVMCVCVGCGLPFMRDPAADVTFLHVEAKGSASHTHTYLYTSHTSPTGNVCFLLQFSSGSH